MMTRFLLVKVAAFILLPVASALVISERAQMARGRLLEALSSPSGKLTLSPEIVVPEPSDPTAILLQSSLITTMSQKMRTQAKANAAFISGGIPAMKTFCYEQELARGNFPGPVPVIFCDKVEDMAEVAEAGAEGVLVSICDGKEISSLEDISSDSSWSDVCKAALENGVQPIPEITLGEAAAKNWRGDEFADLVSKIAEITGDDPVAILLTVNQLPPPETEDDDEEEEVAEVEATVPQLPKGLGKKVPILGSIRAKAGAGRMGEETGRYKAAGFTGAVLRQECMPSISMSQDLEYVTSFWSACIGDLKSLKSKSFKFASRNNLEKNVALEWATYQMDVIQSGALGDPNDNAPPQDLNPSSGDYQGF
jgi:hypothetical protein